MGFILFVILLLIVIFLFSASSKSSFGKIGNEMEYLCTVPCSDRVNDPYACCECIANMDTSHASYRVKFGKCMCNLAKQYDYCYPQSLNTLIMGY